ncbi:hypothetical protein IID24_01035 [Patescibacteria group bacterium]|nr:hypothetical protein [Patescibacteria group bacterium]
MNRLLLREKARKLREQGKTYSEIQQKLGAAIPKSTFSYWCKDVSLPDEYFDKVKLLNTANAAKGGLLPSQ